jgi:zinc transport system permease protein
MCRIDQHGRRFGGWFACLLAAVGLLGLSPEAQAENNGVEAEIESLRQQLDDEAGADSADAGEVGSNQAEASRPSSSQNVGLERADATNEPQTSAPPHEASTSFWANWRLYRDPLLVGLIAGGVLAFLGVYVVARRIVFVSAALSQVSALGVTGGFLLISLAGITGAAAAWIPPLFAILLAIAVVFGLTWAGDDPSLPRDSVLGTSFVVPMALVLVLAPYIAQEMHQIESLLHGSAVVVRDEDLWTIAISAVLIMGTQVYAFRGFLFASLDPKVARTQGLPVGMLDGVLFTSIALMTGLATRAIGALPTFAMTLLPALGALGLNAGLLTVFAVAGLLGGTSGAGGYLVAYEMGWSVGAAQTLVAATLMLVTRSVGWIGGR